MKERIPTLIVLLILSLSVYRYSRVSEIKSSPSPLAPELQYVPKASQAQLESLLNKKAIEEKEAELQAAASVEKTAFQLKVEKLHIPSVAEARAEVEKQPHRTPEVLIQGSLHLGKVFDAVVTSHDARLFAQKLSSCIDGSSPTVTSMQVLCFRYLERLSSDFSEVRLDYEMAANHLSEETRALYQLSYNHKAD